MTQPKQTNKHAKVTGASSGIGKAIAKVFARAADPAPLSHPYDLQTETKNLKQNPTRNQSRQQFVAEGAKVAACGRNRDGLESSAQCHVVGDITEKGVCEQVVSSSVEQLGGMARVRVSYHISYQSNIGF